MNCTPEKPIFSQLAEVTPFAPILDDLFSELTQQPSDLGFDLGSVERQQQQRFGSGALKSEPVDLADMERILLQPSSKKPSIRQPFNSRLAAYSASSSAFSSSFSSLPSVPDSSNPFLLRPVASSGNNNDVFSDLFSDPSLSQASTTPLQNAPLIDLQSASNLAGGKIQVKVINSGLKVQKTQAPAKRVVPSYHSTGAAPTTAAPQYRTYGKKRLPIGPDYADFVCRLQNDIPFDSSEEDEEEDEAYGALRRSNISEADEEDDEEDDSESEDQSEAKIPPQELLELFEDQCQGSASLTNRKHQISIKRNLLLMAAAKKAAQSPLMSQAQFELLSNQISQHFQFLIQNLALSNEIEGGEGITLLSLKLLVQLHLHLDSSCNFSAPLSAPAQPAQTFTISCLKPATPSKINPITAPLSDLIPLGIHRVAVIAGFLARPGQKQFLSLSALRADISLKPKSSCLPLSLRLKPHAQLNGSAAQLLSNAFYNIITLFHEFIDAKLLESTINMSQLSKHLELPSNEAFLLYPAPSQNLSSCAAVKTAKFSPAEDALLLCGLKRFGCGNWESIQAAFLPCRAAKQLAIRYKNLSSRREPMNPVKEFNERMMMPLSEIEEDLLFKGVQKFGNEFHLISQHYLPHRPATVLRKLWKALDINNS